MQGEIQEKNMSDQRESQPVVVVEHSGGLGSFLLGLAVGAGLALLFAPKTGEETRRTIKDQGKKLRAIAGERADELQDSLEHGYQRTKERLEEGLATARRKVEEKKESTVEAIEAGKAAVHSAREELDNRLSKARAERKKATVADETGE